MPLLILPSGHAAPVVTQFPAVKVEMMFTQSAWTDITPYYDAAGGAQVTITRGSNRVESPVIRYDAGTATIPLFNGDRRFDPTNLSGPYVAGGKTLVTPTVPVRVSATYESVTYRLFTGTVDAWTLSYSQPSDAMVSVDCTDGFRILAAQARTANKNYAGGGEDAGARVTRILNDCGWPAARRSIVPGDSTLQPTLLGGTPVGVVPLAVSNAGGAQSVGVQSAVSTLAPLDELQLVADTEMGELYISGNGFLVFRNRHALWTDARSMTRQATFGDLPGTSTSAAQVGAYLDATGMGAADFLSAGTLFQSWTGVPCKVRRDYRAPSDFTVDPRYSVAAANGIKMLITLAPAYNPVSATDLANMTTFLSSLKSMGLDAEITLWHEPFFAGLTSTQYIAMVNYYGPTVRQYYPLAFVTSLSSVVHNNENSYYPGDSAVDKIATDMYAINLVNGQSLDSAAVIADSAVPPKPFGVWEFNGLVSGGNFLLQPNSGFEPGSAGTWTAAGNSSIAVSSAQAHSGSWSLAVTSAAAGNMAAAHCTAANITTQGLACVPGDQITAGTWFRAQTTARSCQAAVTFYTAGGAAISTLAGTAVPDTATGWTQATATVTAPATAAFCRAQPGVLSAGAAGEVHYVDDVTLSNLSSGYTQAQITTFFSYLQTYLAARLAAGKANADVLLFNGSGPNSTEIQSASDFRIPLYQSLYAALNLPAAYVEIPYAAVVPEYGDTTLWNGAIIANQGGDIQQAADAASQRLPPDGFGPHVYDSENLIADSDFQALGYAQWIVLDGKNPELRFASLSVDPAAQPADLYPQVLGREIGDRVTITRRPPGGGTANTRDVFIRGISHQFTDSAWLTTWVLQDATSLPPQFILDDAVNGVLDTSSLGF